MKVLQLINNADLHLGGAEKVVSLLHRDLSARGVESCLISLEACDLNGVDHARSLGLRSVYDPIGVAASMGELRRLSDEFDIIHCHLFPTSFYSIFLRRLKARRAKYIFTEHSTKNRRRDSRFGRFVDRFTYNRFDRICCVSEGAQRALLECYPAIADKTAVVYNGIDFAETPGTSLQSRPNRIVSIGSLKRVKNIETALRAFAASRHADWIYDIFGQGPELQPLQDLAVSLGIADYVNFRGYTSDVMAELQAAKIFLMPSLWEGFGLAALEAMTCGLAVIASDVPGIREVVGDDGECGILVEPTSVEQIADALSLIMKYPERLEEMGYSGAERSRRFNSMYMMDAYYALYKELVVDA